jgi:uncharacterized protein YggE
MNRSLILPILLIGVAACSKTEDRRGVDREETLLQVSAIGRADTRPDEARFTAGVSTMEATAAAASASNNEAIQRVVRAVQEAGVKPDDVQTRTVSLSRIDYGKDRGRYRADNMVEVRVRNVDRASQAIAAATQAGANIVSGPDLRVSDQEAANKSAYAQAYKSARARADAYAQAANLKVARVLAIREAGSEGGDYYPPPISRVAAPEQAAPPPPAVMPGLNTSVVRIQVDFALAE